MADDVVLKGRPVRLKLPAKLKGSLIRAQVEEGLSQLTETTIEFVSTDLDLDMQKIVGERLELELDAPKKKTRYFQGHCVSAEFLGTQGEQGYFRATVRPWLWFLTRTSNCRIFQDKSVIDIIKAIFGDRGFSDFKDRTKHRYAKRSYCVQYRESDFDFLSRLMEEEGIYYFFTHDKTKETLVLADEASTHKAIEDHPTIDFYARSSDYRRDEDHLFEWRGSESIQTGKVTLQDYDFEKPKSDLKSVKALSKGRHRHNKYELYDYPGRHGDVKTGEHHARVKVEGFASHAQRSRAAGNVRQMAVGTKFKMKKHPRKAENAEYLVISARHELQVDAEVADKDIVDAILGPMLDFDRSNSPDIYRSVIEVQPIKEPYRAPQTTPRPESPGMQTAVVVGKRGEEIWTDKYGRVKIQFHWDRDGKKDENASCWVRTSVPWSGKNWGIMAVPRVGQEVVVQFEDGDPDRPLITGMVYNGDTKFPHPLPANQTQIGIKTNTSKGGNGFSELIFEDKKDAEFVRLQSERDFKQIIKNSAEITVGLEHKKPGFFKQTIHGDKTETVKDGDHAFTVAKGKETLSVAKDRTTKIGGKDETTVDGDHKLIIKGTQDTKVSKGYEIDVGAALEMSARSKIVLKCGGSKIEMTPAKVTISAPQVDVKASATAKLTANGQLKMEGKMQAKLKGAGMLSLEGGGMTQVKSSGLLNVKGSLTMIN